MFFNFNNLLMNAAGCKCTTKEELDNLKDDNYVGSIVTKSSTLKSKIGNELPRYYEDSLGTINSMGLPNLGYKFYFNYYMKNIGNFKDGKYYIHSIFPFNKDEVIEMLNYIDENLTHYYNNYNCNYLTPYYIELNLSCPNIPNKPIISKNFSLLEDILTTINDRKYKHLYIGLKLPPYYENYEFVKIVNIIKNCGIKFITCCNSIPNGILINEESKTIKPKDGFGGIGGKYILPISSANVHKFYNYLKNSGVLIFACGGINCGRDVLNYILLGANAVQIGSEFMKNSKIFEKVQNEFNDIIIDKYDGIELNEIIGKIQPL